MAKGYKPTEYIYSSARLRAMENGIVGKDKILHLAEADSAESIMTQLADFGFGAAKEGGSASREEILERVLAAGYEEVAKMECRDAVKFLRYQYDANNIKAVIKCNARGISPRSMLISLGSVSPEETIRAFENKDYGAYPENTAKAIPQAEEAFAATANPQKIDFLIDKACFADMRAETEKSGIGLAKKLVITKIDVVNVMVTLRLMRMKLGNRAEGLLKEAFIDGGSYGFDFYANALKEGEDGLAQSLSGTPYGDMGEAIAEGKSLGTLEKTADDLWLNTAKEAKYVTFGAEVAIGYVAALEYEIKNVRILLASKDAGISPDAVKERLRESYV